MSASATSTKMDPTIRKRFLSVLILLAVYGEYLRNWKSTDTLVIPGSIDPATEEAYEFVIKLGGKGKENTIALFSLLNSINLRRKEKLGWVQPIVESNKNDDGKILDIGYDVLKGLYRELGLSDAALCHKIIHRAAVLFISKSSDHKGFIDLKKELTIFVGHIYDECKPFDPMMVSDSE